MFFLSGLFTQFFLLYMYVSCEKDISREKMKIMSPFACKIDSLHAGKFFMIFLLPADFFNLSGLPSVSSSLDSDPQVKINKNLQHKM